MPPTKLRQTLETLAAAAIGGATTAMADYLTGHNKADVENLWKVALTGAIIGAASLWAKRPSDKKKEEEQ